MQDIRTLGRMPRDSKADDVDDHEYRLAQTLHNARKRGHLSADQEAEVDALKDIDLRGVLAVAPVTRQWKYKGKTMKNEVSVSRTQSPLLPQKQCTLHGVQGKTADPGFIAHLTFPRGLKEESIWLAYYVILSRPRSFSRLLCHTLPDRSIIEGGPPSSISDALEELFAKKIKDTKIACAKARAQMGWPARR